MVKLKNNIVTADSDMKHGLTYSSNYPNIRKPFDLAPNNKSNCSQIEAQLIIDVTKPPPTGLAARSSWKQGIMQKYRTLFSIVEWISSTIKPVNNISIVWKAQVFSLLLVKIWLASKVG